MNEPSYVLIDDAYNQQYLLVVFDTEAKADALVSIATAVLQRLAKGADDGN